MSSSSPLAILVLFVILLLSSSPFANSTFSDTGGNVDNHIDNELPKHEGLSTNPACQADIGRICGKNLDNFPDLDVLECILNQKRNEVEEVSEACQNVLWHYRKSITEEEGFMKLAADGKCVDEFKGTNCLELGKKEPGFSLVNCLIDNKDKVEKANCLTLITRLEGVIFGDYEMIQKFATDCEGDIKKYKCGRNDFGQSVLKKLPHSQGKTIECLSEKIQELTRECSKQILRVAELQTEDFHLDRGIYFGCKDDREKFCSNIYAGKGRIYKCLIRHKLDERMSTECREQLYRRQKLGWQDYKASGIVISCRDDIKKYKCRQGVNASDKHIRLSQILLCLENEYHKGQDIDGQCMDEIRQQRKLLLEDYSVTPELLTACKEDKDRFCPNKGLHGKTLHCLMDHAAQSRREEERLNVKCLVELENILKTADVSSDWEIDPVLKESCQKVVDSSSCSKYPSNQVLDCLMHLMVSESGPEANIMTEDCEDTLIQIQYFLARNWELDSNLFKICNDDARKICGAKADWWDDPKRMDPSRGPVILSCLFRNMDAQDSSEGSKKTVSPQCAAKVRETMRQRALSVHLLPEIEDACMEELTDFCSERTKPGEELRCLQEHLEQLEKSCRVAVTNFTEIEMKNPTVDPFIWKHCRPYLEDKCNGDKSEDGDVLECLFNLKSEVKDKKCKVSIEHLQLLKLKEIRFTPKFKTQCQSDVIRYCNDPNMRPLTSWKVVHCLSKNIRDDIVTENTLKVSKGCRKQVRNLLLTKLQLENGAASGDKQSVYKLCSKFIIRLCGQVPPGAGRIFECLRASSNQIPTDSECHDALFRLEQETDSDYKADIVLNTDCATEMKMFCNPEPENMLNCLRLNNDKEGFGAKCRKVMMERTIEQNADSRLNPRLHKACKLDISKFCSRVNPGQGRVLGCLKNVFVNPKNRLSTTCSSYIAEIIKSSAKENIKYDSDLYIACRTYVDGVCRPQNLGSDSKNEPDNGYTEECLKQLYQDRKIQNNECRAKVGLLIQSSMIDIHIDNTLYQACSIDLVRHCDTVPPGEARLLKCLFTVLHSEQESHIKTGLSEKCRFLLSKRGELFHLADETNPGGRMESLMGLVEEIRVSPNRNYFLTTAMSIVGLIFIFGIFCGRVTRRTAQQKNK